MLAKKIAQARLLHNDRYDYSCSEYLGADVKTTIVCPDHGPFQKSWSNHVSNKQGCPKCAFAGMPKHGLVLGNVAKNREGIAKLTDKLGKYPYEIVTDLTKLANNRSPVELRCGLHGLFTVLPISVLQSRNYSQGKLKQQNHLCPQCRATEAASRFSALPYERFAEAASEIHGNKYDYSLVEFINSVQKVKIGCPKHGVFEQRPVDHLKGCGCPRCNESKGEASIARWLDSHGVEYLREVCIPSFNPRKKFDFFLPTLELYLEYDGQQHFQGSGSWGKTTHAQQDRDRKRNSWCTENGIKLEVITYKDDVLARLLEITKGVTIMNDGTTEKSSVAA